MGHIKIGRTVDVHLASDELRVVVEAITETYTPERVGRDMAETPQRVLTKMRAAVARLESELQAEEEFRASLTDEELQHIRERREQARDE